MVTNDSDNAEDWESVLEELAARRVASRAMGGDERLEKHRAAGKLDARAGGAPARSGFVPGVGDARRR